MPRLFVAIDLPADIKSELTRLTPAVDGLRAVKPDHLHLTLHFLGECALEPVLAALLPVQFAVFEMALAGVGEFRQRGGDRIVWAGVNVVPELQRLHADLATALQSIGYQPESRPFSPHITLARGRPALRAALQEFLNDHAAWRTREFPVTEFCLMSSKLTPQGSLYTCERVFASS